MTIHQLPTQNLVGQLVGNYYIEHLLSSGQSNAVYLARQADADTLAAIIMYFLPDTFSVQARSRFMRRFAQIASALKMLRHPNLTPIYDYGIHTETPYIITPYVTTGSLADQIKKNGPCNAVLALQILKQVAAGLDHAHNQGIVHRALKPAHILLNGAQPVQVAGLGQADIMALEGIEGSDHPYAHLLTITGAFLGAPESTAPECVQGYPADARSDIYGLGVLLFELLSGQPPFQGNDPFTVALQHVHKPIPSLYELRPDLPEAIDQLINRTLARDPAQRFQRASDLVTSLAHILGSSTERLPGFNDTALPRAAHAEIIQEESLASPSTGKWQIIPPIVTGGRLPAISPSVAHSSPTSPTTGRGLDEVSLFDIRFRGHDNLQYTVRTSVTNSSPLSIPGLTGQRRAEPVQKASPAQKFQIEEKSTDPIPAVPLAAAEEEKDDDADKSFLLRIVQPGLTGLMDGSVSTLAPIFATAIATHKPFTTFLVGMASALGAGISMAFAEALSDDGELTGRGSPFIRGGITGLMTFLSGAGHTLPFLITDINLALILAYIVVGIELIAIAAIRHRFFNTSWWLSIVQVVGGGILVFATAILLGSA
ncbi:hypothetical protein EPA93_19480 [Ktedonosporobacter rubrisoli]|uniref:non-specific serine/threonine protein kinase n=1 Tax=Ktedonosporobacter rubrisoli TaxID=2509675 RepID=A0A4P6JRG4_KTERU|nr:protein kinase [Ktedonosporobacter rubrisoli]QBD78057.1 hypothetical protein EPA93_19480 [Ktedonosporobacter rubrisoli]